MIALHKIAFSKCITTWKDNHFKIDSAKLLQVILQDNFSVEMHGSYVLSVSVREYGDHVCFLNK